MDSQKSTFDDVSVVMITRNEELAVGKVIDDALYHLPGAEVIVVDGSSDNTASIARRHGATVFPEPGGGPAPALLYGLRASKRDIVVTVDADDTYPAEAFPILVEAVRSGLAIAGTDRIGRRRPKAMPIANWAANTIFNMLATVRAHRRICDVHSGQRAYRRELIDRYEWDTTGLAFPVDLILLPACGGEPIREFPIEYRDRIGQTTLARGKSGLHTLRRLLRPMPKTHPRAAS